MKIENSVALVTGANRGIGRAFARELLARGAKKVYAGTRSPAAVGPGRRSGSCASTSTAPKTSRQRPPWRRTSRW